MSWSIDKSFHWAMGHRVHSQALNRPDLSISTECACKHLHGHEYTLKVFVSSGSLDDRGFVIDFKELNFVKLFLDTVLDHRFMVDINDPNFELITGVCPYEISKLRFVNYINLSDMFPSQDPNIRLHRDSFVLVNFCPTSENICKSLLERFQERLRDFAYVSAVELWESAKSHCRYTAPILSEFP